MNKEEIIYPSMVIRSQAEAIELLEKENKQLKDKITRLREILKQKLITMCDAIEIVEKAKKEVE